MPEPPPYDISPERGRPATATPPPRNRHGKSPSSEPAPSPEVRSRLVRLAVLPASLVGATATAAVTSLVLHLKQGAVDATTWGIVASAAALGCGCIAAAVSSARSQARREARHYAALRQTITSGKWPLDEALAALERGEQLHPRVFTHPAPRTGDPREVLTYELAEAQHNAREALVQAARLTESASEDSHDKVEVFVNLARRLQSLVHRMIRELDDLENQVEDPDLLRRIFGIDHLATRIRRHAENLAVLGGAVSRRQWTNPVTLTEVLRSSIAEVEQYSRVKLVPPIEGTLRGHAVADVIHLLAELVENATAFSKPDTQILLRSRRVTAGIAVEVEDRGLGIPQHDQDRINALLADPGHVDIATLLADGRIGLFVVSSLARRHGIAVKLTGNIYGGVQAILVLPHQLLGTEEGQAPAQAMPAEPGPAAVSPPAPAPAPAAPQQTWAASSAPGTQAAPRQQPQPQPQMRQPVAPPPSAPRPAMAQARFESRRESPSAGAGIPASHGSAQQPRPVLPQRRPQSHLAPELRGGPLSRQEEAAEEPGFNPGLLAGINRGMDLAGTSSDVSPGGDSRWDSYRSQGEEPHHGER
ncbi:ATP-binding protein [Streptomyces sp. NPDC046862]|uniref:sensor histidine kinase n=1 Tax=Streptomyces sp. NPDC046862 TaxID=3154603 RepID=UPI003451AE23